MAEETAGIAAGETKPAAEEKPVVAETKTIVTDTKPAGEEKPAAEVKPVAPEKYDFKIPDGSILKPMHVEKIAAYAKAQGFSQEQAQAYLNERHGELSGYVTMQSEKWLAEAKLDKEIGGDAFNKNVELAKRYVTRYGSDALKKELDSSGLGNHPELVRMIVKAAKDLNAAEDELVKSRGTTTSRPTPESVFYTENKQT